MRVALRCGPQVDSTRWPDKFYEDTGEDKDWCEKYMTPENPVLVDWVKQHLGYHHFYVAVVPDDVPWDLCNDGYGEYLRYALWESGDEIEKHL